MKPIGQDRIGNEVKRCTTDYPPRDNQSAHASAFTHPNPLFFFNDPLSTSVHAILMSNPRGETTHNQPRR
jgi:hypothetical protein